MHRIAQIGGNMDGGMKEKNGKNDEIARAAID
jgi:hypothetical protein